VKTTMLVTARELVDAIAPHPTIGQAFWRDVDADEARALARDVMDGSSFIDDANAVRHLGGATLLAITLDDGSPGKDYVYYLVEETVL
jgi:hypothetical protein